MRIFQPQPLHAALAFALTPEASHHVRVVMRAKMADPLTVFNGEGGEYGGYIADISQKKITVQLTTFNSDDKESPLTLYLAQGISRGEKMDYTIQKAVELGINKIFPVFTERSTIKLDKIRAEKKVSHWQSIAIAACEQCGRNRIPSVLSPLSFEEMLAQETAATRFILSPTATDSISNQSFSREKTVVLFVGPEGGFSDAELQKAQRCNVLPLSLGPRILRTETAACVAIALFQSYLGDLGCRVD